MSARATLARDATEAALCEVRHCGTRFAREMSENGWEPRCRRQRRSHCDLCGSWGLVVHTWRRSGVLGRSVLQTVECPHCGRHERDVDAVGWASPVRPTREGAAL